MTMTMMRSTRMTVAVTISKSKLKSRVNATGSSFSHRLLFVCNANSQRRSTKKVSKSATGHKSVWKVKSWLESFEDLKKYQQKHGYCNVRKTENPRLRAWVDRQKKRFRRPCGKSSQLKPDQVENLTSIGLNFGKATTGQTWLQSFKALSKYQETHGHCNLPGTQNCRLHRWVYTQKRRLRGPYNGYSQLRSEQEDKLKSIGFDFHINHHST